MEYFFFLSSFCHERSAAWIIWFLSRLSFEDFYVSVEQALDGMMRVSPYYGTLICQIMNQFLLCVFVSFFFYSFPFTQAESTFIFFLSPHIRFTHNNNARRLDPQKIILLTEIAGNFFFLFFPLSLESREANHVGRVSVYCLRMFARKI